MKYSVTVKPNAKHAKVQTILPTELLVFVDKPLQEGKANKRLCELLAEHFQVPKSTVTILHGKRSRRKIIEIEQ